MQMTNRLWWTVGLTFALAACGGGGGADDGSGGDGTSGGEYSDTIAPTADASRGQQRFDAVCGACHPGGDSDVGPRIRDLGWSVSRMRRQIREGSGGMRPISTARLGDEDLDHVLAHLRTLGAIGS